MTKHVDQEMLGSVWRMLNSDMTRGVLKMIGIDGAKSYTEIMKYIETFTHKKKTGVAAYHIRKLITSYMIKRDDITKRYYLTRIGVEALSVVESFNEICTKFDLDDCGADGKIEIRIIERKNEDRLQDEIKCLVCTHTAKSVKSIRIHHRMKHG